MRKYNNITEQAVYENSRDCLYYGYGFNYLNKCGLSDDEALIIWKQAKNDLSKINFNWR